MQVSQRLWGFENYSKAKKQGENISVGRCGSKGRQEWAQWAQSLVRCWAPKYHNKTAGIYEATAEPGTV